MLKELLDLQEFYANCMNTCIDNEDVNGAYEYVSRIRIIDEIIEKLDMLKVA